MAWIDWSFADAVEMAITLHGTEEYHDVDLDKLATDLWRDMMAENEENLEGRI